MKTQDYLTDTKVNILLNALDFQIKEIQRRQDREQVIFQWSTSMLLAIFAAIIALAGHISSTTYPVILKTLASVMVSFPILFSIFWIFRLSEQATNNAGVVEVIEDILYLFEEGYYGPKSPYPKAWEGNLKHNLEKRRTPIYYCLVLITMTICVVISIWLML
jgi:hypothetical protein